jgi:hypothetical protein
MSTEYEFSVDLYQPQMRKCDYQLAMQGCSVFADFVKVTKEEKTCLQLTNISFDGYGCCSCAASDCIMNFEDSQTLIALFSSDYLGESRTDEIVQILGNFFNEYKGCLWEDALLERGILPKEE